MSISTRPVVGAEMHYPDSDGQRMAENEVQYEWIVTIKGGLDAVFRDRDDVFVAGDMLWYPIEGDNKTRIAPDVMVVFDRPKLGYRGSYLQWKEGGIPPQVVFEILSPGNRFNEMLRKFRFYERFGVEEYYLYDPDQIELEGWSRKDGELLEIPETSGWVSPRLGIRFEVGDDLTIYGPDGQRFVTFVEIARQRDEERRLRIESEQRAERMAARLRELGLNPDET